MDTTAPATRGFTVAELPIPPSLDAPGAGDYIASVELVESSQAGVLGHGDFIEGPVRALVGHEETPYTRSLRFAARDGAGRIIGVAAVHLPLAENTDMAIAYVAVDPAHRRRGIGTALFRAAEDACVDLGRTRLNAWVDYPTAPLPGEGPEGSLVLPSKGDGAVPADSPTTLFARSLGMELKQVERVSRMDLPRPAGLLEDLEARARAASEEEYDVVSWVGRVPEDAVEDYCRMVERMDVDPPLGGLEWEESVWDEARLRTAEDRDERRDNELVTTCAVHRASGDLVAFTVLLVMREKPTVAYQEDTLVMGGHRGHRLGMLVKTVNLKRTLEAFPHVGRVYTWNAEENEHMLAINVAMGFVPVHSEGAWQKSAVNRR
ncbi:GNAT family N-acetyltransferase [Zafaria sp. Z1313]|uniref:GNAT family N-acetyltransferase n=1 Tax=unclassified Zafaria TaxID=2828765 RepID=UPI002E77349E|nr:GNAT family N-acetyltransferase [Zafaria sp. J156]MEE1620580.1 GNAT family N-acetyltransferase [Zafaria sp. J156]